MNVSLLRSSALAGPRGTWRSIATVIVTLSALAALVYVVTTRLEPAGPAVPNGPVVVLAQHSYAAGHYDSGPIALPMYPAQIHNTVCGSSDDAVVQVRGQLLYSVDGGTSWREWAPFAMGLGESVWDAKRGQFTVLHESCGTTSGSPRGWTHVRAVLDLDGGPAIVSAQIEPAQP